MFSLSERSAFYSELGKLLVAGFPFLKSVEVLLAARPSGGVRQLLQRLRVFAAGGANITDAFSRPGMPFHSMEISLIAACERSGQLHRGCEFLSKYFARLDATRRSIAKRAAYPIFILHFGVVMLSIPRLFQGEPAIRVFWGIAITLGGFYIAAALIYIAFKVLHRTVSVSDLGDTVLGAVPLIGSIHKSLALSRFCTAFQMQLDAGVNVMDSLISAANASESALIKSAAHRMLPGIRDGNQVGAELAAAHVFPPDFLRGFVVGEQTGTLDSVLIGAADEHQVRAMAGIETLAEWIPRLIYVVITLYIGWSMIVMFQSAMTGVNKMLESPE
ncbi:MAG TPA: type II secretion system F family protein [Chthoniobacterales bacterium]